MNNTIELFSQLENSKHTFLIQDGIKCTYSEFFYQVKEFERTFNTPDNFVIISENTITDQLIKYCYCWLVGKVPVPLNPNLDQGTKQVIIENLKEFESNYSFEKCNFAFILFTSGSSGVPKGVPISHFSLISNASRTAKVLGINKNDRIYINTPFFTTSSILHVLTQVVGKGTIIYDNSFSFGDDLVKKIKDSESTVFGGVPAHFIRIVGSPKINLPKLRILVNSGDHLSSDIIGKLKQFLPSVSLFCMYGLTEVSGRLCVLDPNDLLKKIGSVGKPLQGMQIKIVDDEGKECLPRKEGEVIVNGDMLMPGYINYNFPNEAFFCEYGFRTGDIGYLDDDGFLFLIGRKDNVFKVGGEKVSLNLIESSLIDLPGLMEFFAYKYKHPYFGFVPGLKYTLKEGMSVSKKEIINHLKTKVPKNHLPVKIDLESKLNKTQSGKFIRK